MLVNFVDLQHYVLSLGFSVMAVEFRGLLPCGYG